MSATHTTFEALGTAVFVAVRRPEELATARQLARRVLDDVDETCSRFRADSDLTRANRYAGRWVDVDPVLAAAVAVALDAAQATDGLVDPLLGRAMVALGYDRDLRSVLDQPAPEVPLPAPRPGAWRELEVDLAGRVRVPRGTALDLGATGKAWSADVVAAAFEAHLDGSALISVGGDLRVAAADDEPWAVAVGEHPGARPATTVTIRSGALATSSTQVRRWPSGGVVRHHLLDPRTGRPAESRWRTVSTVATTCTAANTATTAALVDAEAIDPDRPARLVELDGTVRLLGGWPADPTTDDRSAA